MYCVLYPDVEGFVAGFGPERECPRGLNSELRGRHKSNADDVNVCETEIYTNTEKFINKTLLKFYNYEKPF